MGNSSFLHNLIFNKKIVNRTRQNINIFEIRQTSFFFSDDEIDLDLDSIKLT